MKIVFLSNSLKTSVIFRFSLMKMLKKRGHEVVLCTPNDSEPDVVKLEKAGIRYEELDFSRTSLSPLKDLTLFFNYLLFLRKEAPDFVFTNTIKSVIYGGMATKVLNLKTSSVIPGLGYTFLKTGISGFIINKITCFLYSLGLKQSQYVYFLNEFDRSLFVDRNILDKEKTKILKGEGIDTLKFSRSTSVVTEPMRFTFIGRLLKDKGITEFIVAAKKVLEKYNDKVEFQIVGPIDSNPSAIDKSELLEMIGESKINYLGEVNNIKEVLEKSSVFVLPSYREGMSVSIMEAMAMELPVITTDAPGCIDAVDDGFSGYIVPVKNSERLFNAMEKTVLNPSNISKLGARGRQVAVEKFDARIINTKLINDNSL